jgi:hypothetical protein
MTLDLDPAGEHLAAHAVATPERAAVVMHPSGDARTYADLERSSVRLAHVLRARGLGRGDHLAVLLDNQPEFFDVVWAARGVGGAGQHVVAAVQHDHHRLVGVGEGQRLRGRLAGLQRDRLGAGTGGHVVQPHRHHGPARLLEAGAEVLDQAGLAHAARAGDRHEAVLVQQALHELHLIRPPDEGRQRRHGPKPATGCRTPRG